MTWQTPSSAPDTSKTDYYQLLQVDSGASTTVIRYAYRYLAAMYHPDNVETADVEKFKLVTDAWRVLSDPNKRNAYDLQANIAQAVKGPSTLQSAIGRASSAVPGAASKAAASPTPPASPVTPNTHSSSGQQAPEMPSAPNAIVPQSILNTQPVPPNGSYVAEPKHSTAWSEVELRLAVLQVMLDAKRKKPQTGGASAKLLMDCLGVELSELEYILWYLREKNYIKSDESQFVITIAGVDYLVDQLSKTEILNPR